MTPLRRALLLAATVLAGCAGDNDDVRPPAPATVVTTQLPGADRACPTGSRGTSRSDFDGMNGEFIVQLYTVDVATRSLTFDVVQWLVGDDALREHRRTNPSDQHGPPNDYVLVNALVRTDSATVSANAAVWTLDEQLGYKATAFEQLASTPVLGRRPGLGLYWLTFERGTVTRACQQYTP